MFTKMVYRSDKTGRDYEFTVKDNGMQYIATCDQPEGGLNTSGYSIEDLVRMIPDCVDTWEM